MTHYQYWGIGGWGHVRSPSLRECRIIGIQGILWVCLSDFVKTHENDHVYVDPHRTQLNGTTGMRSRPPPQGETNSTNILTKIHYIYNIFSHIAKPSKTYANVSQI